MSSKSLGKIVSFAAPVFAVANDTLLKKSKVSKDTPILSDASKTTTKTASKPLGNPIIAGAATLAATGIAGPAAGAAVAATSAGVQADNTAKAAKRSASELRKSISGIGNDVAAGLGESDVEEPAEIAFRSSIDQQRKRKGRRASVLTPRRGSLSLTSATGPAPLG